jgi:hypothetical protein
MPAPNTKISVKKANGTPIGRDSWVELFQVIGGNKNWLGSSTTDIDGNATFNIDTTIIDTTTAKFALQIHAPWNLKSEYVDKMFDNGGSGFSWNQIDVITNGGNVFALPSPNLRVAVKVTSAILNKWGWFMVESSDSAGLVTGWISSAGLDEFGKSSVLIPSNGKFKLTAYPGPGKAGAATSCFINTDAGGAITSVETCTAGVQVTLGQLPTEAAIKLLTLTLESGNVRGHLTKPDNSPAVNVVVYANYDLNDANAVITSTDENGNYGLQLDPNKTWSVKYIPLTPTDGTLKLAGVTISSVVPPLSGFINLDRQLVNA